MFLNEVTNACAMLVEIDQQVLKSDKRVQVIEKSLNMAKSFTLKQL